MSVRSWTSVAVIMRIVTAAIFIGAWFLVPNFGTGQNVRFLLFSVSAIGIAAVGLSFITISGRLFSLSVGATVAVSTVGFATWLYLGLLPAVALTLLLGAVIGAAQGAVVGYLKANPIVTTIAAAAILVGLAQLYTNGRNITGDGDPSFLQSDILGPLPFPVFMFLLVTVVAWFVHRYTRFGRGLTLVGLNERAALVGGIGAGRLVTIAFALSAVAAALAGTLVASQAGQGNLQLGTSYGFDAIVAVVVGGVSIKGGIGSPLDAAVGALFVALVGNVLVLSGFTYENQLVLKGLFVVIAVVLAGRSAASKTRG